VTLQPFSRLVLSSFSYGISFGLHGSCIAFVRLRAFCLGSFVSIEQPYSRFGVLEALSLLPSLGVHDRKRYRRISLDLCAGYARLRITRPEHSLTSYIASQLLYRYPGRTSRRTSFGNSDWSDLHEPARECRPLGFKMSLHHREATVRSFRRHLRRTKRLVSVVTELLGEQGDGTQGSEAGTDETQNEEESIVEENNGWASGV
jgi:hypothetical protein